MNDIFSKDLSGEIVSPNEPGYDVLIDDIFRTMETAQELATHDIAGCKNRLWSHRGRRQRGDERCPGMTVVAGNPARIIKTIEK